MVIGHWENTAVSAPQDPHMLLISSLVAGTFVLATSFSLIAVLTD